MIFIRKESFREYISFYPITSAIVLLNTIMIAVTILSGWFVDGEWIYGWGGLSKGTIMNGEFYRLVTYAFIHSGIMHFLSNMIFTIIAAPPIEKLLGSFKFIILFFFSTLMAALVIVLLSSTPYNIEVGESGFGYSLFGFYFYLILFKKNIIDRDSSKMILAFIVIGWITTFAIPGISLGGHLGGFIAGWLFALAVNKSLNRLKVIGNK